MIRVRSSRVLARTVVVAAAIVALLTSASAPVRARWQGGTLPTALSDADFWALSVQLSEADGSFVSRSILKPGLYSGIFPIDDNAAWEKNAATLKQLHKLRERIKALETKNQS